MASHHFMDYKKMFDEAYPNIFLLAKKKSGKTTVINHILKKGQSYSPQCSKIQAIC